jgi:hypothetical protein
MPPLGEPAGRSIGRGTGADHQVDCSSPGGEWRRSDEGFDLLDDPVGLLPPVGVAHRLQGCRRREHDQPLRAGEGRQDLVGEEVARGALEGGVEIDVGAAFVEGATVGP